MRPGSLNAPGRVPAVRAKDSDAGNATEERQGGHWMPPACTVPAVSVDVERKWGDLIMHGGQPKAISSAPLVIASKTLDGPLVKGIVSIQGPSDRTGVRSQFRWLGCRGAILSPPYMSGVLHKAAGMFDLTLLLVVEEDD